MFAQLGDVTFELLGSFASLEETHAAQFAQHDVLAGRARLQAMGNALTELRFSLKLHWKLGDVDAAYGTGRFVGWFVIERLTARTLQMDKHGRTAAREVDVELKEFVGDPNNPLPAPAVVQGEQNPLLAMLPESMQNALNPIAEKIGTAVKIYHAVENDIGAMQNLIQAAREIKNDPAGVLNLVGDVLGVAGGALDHLNGLPEIVQNFGDLAGAAQFAAQAAQAAQQMGSAVGEFRAGIESGSVGGWFGAGVAALDAAAESLGNGAAAVQTLTAFVAARRGSV